MKKGQGIENRDVLHSSRFSLLLADLGQYSYSLLNYLTTMIPTSTTPNKEITVVERATVHALASRQSLVGNAPPTGHAAYILSEP